MSDTAPDRYTPAPLRYPGTGGPIGHRLHARAILAAILVVVLIAFLITGGIVLPPKTNQPPTPPPQLSGKPVAMATLGQPHTAQVKLAATDAVALRYGVSITPAEGWKVSQQKEVGDWLCNSDCSATLWVGVGIRNDTDVAAALQTDINTTTGGPNSGYSNVKLTEVQKQSKSGETFTQYAFVGYTATLVNQNGTIAVSGIFGELLNPTTEVVAFLNFACGGAEAYGQALPDYKSMVQSML